MEMKQVGLLAIWRVRIRLEKKVSCPVLFVLCGRGALGLGMRWRRRSTTQVAEERT